MRKIAFLYIILNLYFHLPGMGWPMDWDEGAEDRIAKQQEEFREYIKQIIAENKDLSNLSPQKSPLLCIWLYSMNQDLLKTLLTLNPNVNIKNQCDETPLTIAVQFGTPESVRQLLEHGANPHIGSASSLFGLPLACVIHKYSTRSCSTQAEMAKLLLQYGAIPELPITHHNLNALQLTKHQYKEIRYITDRDNRIQALKDTNKIFLRHLRVKRLVRGIKLNGKSLPQELVARICQFCVE